MGTGAWEQNSYKSITIAIPHVGLVMTEWAIRLRTLAIPPNINTTIDYAGHLPIDYARNVLVDRAIKAKVDHIFFLDSDVTPPVNALIQLIADNLPIVSGIYRNKIDGLPAVWRHSKFPDGTPGYSPVAKFQSEGQAIIEADAIGMGCCLIRMDVFSKVQYPWFKWTVDVKRRTGRGEDFYLCERAIEQGYKINVDTRIICGHECLAELPPDFGPMQKVKI